MFIKVYLLFSVFCGGLLIQCFYWMQKPSQKKNQRGTAKALKMARTMGKPPVPSTFSSRNLEEPKDPKNLNSEKQEPKEPNNAVTVKETTKEEQLKTAQPLEKVKEVTKSSSKKSSPLEPVQEPHVAVPIKSFRYKEKKINGKPVYGPMTKKEFRADMKEKRRNLTCEVANDGTRTEHEEEVKKKDTLETEEKEKTKEEKVPEIVPEKIEKIEEKKEPNEPKEEIKPIIHKLNAKEQAIADGLRKKKTDYVTWVESDWDGTLDENENKKEKKKEKKKKEVKQEEKLDDKKKEKKKDDKKDGKKEKKKKEESKKAKKEKSLEESKRKNKENGSDEEPRWPKIEPSTNPADEM